MIMTIMSIILIILLLLILISKKTFNYKVILTLSLATLFEIFVSVGYFLQIGSLEVNHTEFLYIFCVILMIFQNVSFNKTKLLYGMLLFLSMCISILIQIVFPYDKMVIPEAYAWDLFYFHNQLFNNIIIGFNQIKEILHTFCYIVIIAKFFCFSPDDRKLFIKKTYQFSKIFILFFLVEFVFVFILNKQETYYNLLKIIFGDRYFSDSAVTSIGISTRLRGFKSEPSMFGYSMFLICLLYLYIYIKKLSKRRIVLIYIILTMFLLITSLSFSAIVCMGLLGVFILVYIFTKSNKMVKQKIIFFGFLFLFCLIIMGFILFNYAESNYYVQRIKMAILSLTNLNLKWNDEYNVYDASTLIRMISMLGTLQYYFDNILFGISMGSTYSHSTFATILASIGTVGVILWIKLTFFSNAYHKYNLVYILIIVIWLITLLILGNGLFPFYGLQNLIIITFFDLYSMNSNFISTRSDKLNDFIPKTIL